MKFLVDWFEPPEISWEKKICGLCKQPSGNESRCFEMSSDDDGDIYQENEGKIKNAIERNDEVFPVFHEQCYFRKRNQYIVEFNYPLSESLIGLFSTVPGIEEISCIEPYRMIVTIANRFNDSKVRSQLEDRYREYIDDNRKTISNMAEQMKDINIQSLLDELNNIGEEISDETVS